MFIGDSYIGGDYGTFGDYAGSRSSGGSGSGGPRWFGALVLAAGALLLIGFIYWVHKSNMAYNKCMEKNNLQTYCELNSGE